MILGCWPVKHTDDFSKVKFQFDGGCFENMKSSGEGTRYVAYNINNFNYNEKSEENVAKVISFHNEHFKTSINYLKTTNLSQASYVNYLLSTHVNDIMAYINGRAYQPLSSNKFCIFSIPDMDDLENYYNFNILRMLFSSYFKDLYVNFEKLLGTVEMTPFELFQLCHFCKGGTFGADKNLVGHQEHLVYKITPVDKFYNRLQQAKTLYSCFEGKSYLNKGKSVLVQYFKEGKYKEIYDEIR